MQYNPNLIWLIEICSTRNETNVKTQQSDTACCAEAIKWDCSEESHWNTFSDFKLNSFSDMSFTQKHNYLEVYLLSYMRD